MDSTDSFVGTGVVHSVAAFAGNVSKATGMSLSVESHGLGERHDDEPFPVGRRTGRR